MMYQNMSAEAFAEQMKQDTDLDILDIRSRFEYDAYHLDYPVTHIPLHEIDLDALIADRTATDKPLYVLCKMGPRAEKLCQLMAAHGQGDDLVVVQGGITGCIENGALIQKSDPFPSIEEIQSAVQDSFQKFMQKFGL